MVDPKEVIAGLEKCSAMPDSYTSIRSDCESCTYNGRDTLDGVICRQLLMRDALSLLKAPEARVANLEELKLVTDDGPFYWMEVRERKAFFPALKIEELGAGRAGPLCIQFAAIFNSGYGPVTVCRFKTEEYNILWRCWTSRPTDEQREKVKWE